MTNPAMLPATHFVGRWLRSSAHPDLGFGYCKQKRGADYVLSYIDIPNVAEHELLVAPASLVDKPIPNGTRVWVRGTGTGGTPARSRLPSTHGRYQVALVGMPRPIPDVSGPVSDSLDEAAWRTLPRRCNMD